MRRSTPRVAPIFSIGAGIRGDYVTTSNEGGYFGDRSTGNGAGSGYLSATLGSSAGFSLTGQVARGFRDPVLSDRYYRGPTGRGFITGNPDLEPETSLQYDLALRYTAPAFRVAAFYYHYDIEDLIERYSTATDFFFFRNRGEARIEGFEVEGQAMFPTSSRWISPRRSPEGKALDDDSYLDDISPANFAATLRKQFGERAFGQMRVAYFSDDEHFGPTERAVPGYTMLDAGAGFRVVKPLELRVIGAQPAERGVSTPARTSARFSRPGRSVSLVAAVKF